MDRVFFIDEMNNLAKFFNCPNLFYTSFRGVQSLNKEKMSDYYEALKHLGEDKITKVCKWLRQNWSPSEGNWAVKFPYPKEFLTAASAIDSPSTYKPDDDMAIQNYGDDIRKIIDDLELKRGVEILSDPEPSKRLGRTRIELRINERKRKDGIAKGMGYESHTDYFTKTGEVIS